MPDYSTIRLEKTEKGIATLTLARPDRLNAISRQMIDELHECLSTLDEDLNTRVLILTGEGRGFCSGTDLKNDREGESEGESADSSAAVATLYARQRKLADLILHMRKIPQPIIAAINGVAAGGGFAFSMAADIRIAAESARFINSFINVGLSAGDVGSTYFLPRLLGLSRAAEILYTGREVSAEEAERIGYVSRVVPEGKALDEALTLARTMLTKSPFGLRMTKEVLNQNIDAPSLESAIYLENRTQSLAVLTGDFRIAMEAFREKRPPEFPEGS